ncbi:BREX-1 system adenine-specific DNA-methyltransferase PglX [Acetoanaerobium noterae]|uniref:BREX-1 system adenine-specific DNA-methyltransferase PglX n=1 Tax=Acetoanaerobium noterae TaxID=745369 RepID=UPI003221E460
MNKSAIKSFAIWARTKLINEITYKSGLIGITDKGISHPLDSSTDNIQHFDIGTEKPYEIKDREIKQRDAYIKRIKEKEATSDYNTAFNYVIEEIAYTWFNRLIAIRFMEVNDYLPSKTRVISSETKGKTEPDMVTSPFDTDMEFTSEEKDYIISLKHDNKLDELFRFLFIKQCNTLNAVLPELFEKTSDYTELLLTISFTDSDGIVSHLVNDIPEEDFTEAVEIIGWLYQYYNEDRKNQVINIYKGTVKKDDIPAATQLFTTDWVVRYMVDNSLGRYWIERNPNSKLREKLEYLVTPKNQDFKFVDEKITPEELTFFDPCMGSGHILVYAFDLLMEIYREYGYEDRESARLIVEKNLYGVDIDDRASQLAYFAVMMRARSYDRRFLTRDISINVCSLTETNNIPKVDISHIQLDLQDTVKEDVNYLLDVFTDAKELGSLITVKPVNFTEIENFMNEFAEHGASNMFDLQWYNSVFSKMPYILKQAKILSKKFTIVCTNPPYMNKIEGQLKKFITKDYKDYSGDLFSVFIYRNFDYTIPNGYLGFMTPFVWMFIKTYEKLREYIINNKSIATLVQMEYSAFEEATVPICSFVLKNGPEKEKGLYIKLSDFKGGMEVQKKKVIEALHDKECKYFYETSKENFSKIPGSPIAYWVSENYLQIFEKGVALKNIAEVVTGVSTGDNNNYLRNWFEVYYYKISIYSTDIDRIDFSNIKWIPYNKGGEARKWFGNNDYIVKWSESKNFHRARPTFKHLYLKEGITWSFVTSGLFSARYYPKGFLWDVAGSPCVIKDKKIMLYTLGYLSTKIANSILKMINPTINCQVDDIQRIPITINHDLLLITEEISTENILIAKVDWDSFETSWDFRKHPLIDEALLISDMDDCEEMDNSSDLETSPEIEIFFDTGVDIVSSSIATSYEIYRDFTERQFNKLKSNEEELNRIFIDIYGLQDELTPDVEDKDVTIYRVFDSKEAILSSMKSSRYALTKHDVIVSFVSYAVGCMFGRYSLDVEGLAYAGGDWDDSKYSLFIPDRDNCIPITDEEYLEDDIVGRFVEFVKVVYGADTLEENLDFIAEALETKGNTSREMIRNYFVKDFYKDHVKTYQKRPIYWLYDSGKQNGFKALVYMHRYTADTTGIVRVDYLHKIQKIYTSEIDRMKYMAENSDNAREVAQAEKRKEKLIKQLKETKEYDEKIAHLALSRIAIDLDDGVKVNYEKVQTAQDGKKLEILGKI